MSHVSILRRHAAHAGMLVTALGVVVNLAAAQSYPNEQQVTLRFRATVGDRPFACGERYEKIGMSSATMSASDFRFYVQDVRLITDDGREVPMKLASDSLWQHENVALLDFENGSGPCSNGTTELRDVIVGTVPTGTYRALRFELGVPFALNHSDLATLPAPLSLTRMFWAWNSGHKFMRVDMRAAPETPIPGDTAGPRMWMIHLGSSNCTPSKSATTVPTTCAHPNRVSVTFEQFDPASHIIVADLAALVAGADVLTNQKETAPGCMSSQEDADCAPLFAALGLPHAKSNVKAEQRFFRLETSTANGNGTGGHR